MFNHDREQEMRRRVVLTGWGQVTQPKQQTDVRIRDPLGLMADASNQAFEMTGSFDASRNLDGLMAVKVMSTYYASVDRLLAEKMGLNPRFSMVSKIGGNSPQALINKAAGMIARGELDSVLVAGAEAYYPRNRTREIQGNCLFQGFPTDYGEDDIIGATESETRHGMILPIHGFPLFETALWSESGLQLATYMKRIGALWASFSEVAATHPNAWTRTPRTIEEIAVPSPSNRFIALPYTKLMNPLLSADLGAAVVLMSEETARRYARKGSRPVYFLGGGYAEDRQRFVIQKSDFTSSLPLKTAADKAIRRSNLRLDDIECFDLYSCFHSAVSIARRMLELKDDDPRPLTLTGGEGFFGGPGNNYSLHAVATLADAIASGRTDNGMITAIGWFMHKHAAGIYGAEPGDTDLSYHDLEDETNYMAGNPPVDIVNEAWGEGVIETYTVVYSREGAPSYAIVYGRTQKGLRFVAQDHPGEGLIEALTSRNQVGARVRLRFDRLQERNLAMLI
jgi:acetyl-CoA C-acetyltransferase